MSTSHRITLGGVPVQDEPIFDLIETLQRYVNDGVPVGNFLHAVLCNDLQASFIRADEWNRANMFLIVSYCWNHLPDLCWGSPEKVRAWLDFKRQQKEMEEVSKR